MADSGSVDYSKLKVAELKKLLKDQGLPITGTKPQLIERLQEAGAAVIEDGDAAPADATLDEEALLSETAEEKAASKAVTAPAAKAKPAAKPATEAAKVPEKEVVEASATEVKSDKDKQLERAKRFGGSVSEDVKKQLRAEKFGIVSAESKKSEADAKKASRAERFGLPVEAAKGDATAVPVDKEKLEARAARFGVTVAPTLTKAETDEKIKKRAERFGTVTSPTLAKAETDEKLLKRKERFGDVNAKTTPEMEEAKKRRLERFAAK